MTNRNLMVSSSDVLGHVVGDDEGRNDLFGCIRAVGVEQLNTRPIARMSSYRVGQLETGI